MQGLKELRLGLYDEQEQEEEQGEQGERDELGEDIVQGLGAARFPKLETLEVGPFWRLKHLADVLEAFDLDGYPSLRFLRALTGNREVPSAGLGASFRARMPGADVFLVRYGSYPDGVQLP